MKCILNKKRFDAIRFILIYSYRAAKWLLSRSKFITGVFRWLKFCKNKISRKIKSCYDARWRPFCMYTHISSPTPFLTLYEAKQCEIELINFTCKFIFVTSEMADVVLPRRFFFFSSEFFVNYVT